jgi:hypothetical protein
MAATESEPQWGTSWHAWLRDPCLALDFEEAWNFTCCRPGRAKFSCPCCLVLQEMLHFLQRTFEARTSSNMRATVRLAQNAPNTMQKEKILMEHGLHDVVVSFIFVLFHQCTQLLCSISCGTFAFRIHTKQSVMTCSTSTSRGNGDIICGHWSWTCSENCVF